MHHEVLVVGLRLSLGQDIIPDLSRRDLKKVFDCLGCCNTRWVLRRYEVLRGGNCYLLLRAHAIEPAQMVSVYCEVS